MSTAATGASDPVLQSYREAISKEEADPNATKAFDDGLERQFQYMVDALRPQPNAQPSQFPEKVTLDSPAGSVKWADPPPAYTDDPPPAYTADPPPAYTVDPPPATAASPSSTQLGDNLPGALQRIAPDIMKAAQTTGMDPKMLAAMVWDESRGQSGAATTNGGTGLSDAGLMQVDAGTFKDLQQKHPELQGKSLGDDLTNLTAGAFLFQDMKKQFGSDALALRAYNSGAGSVNVNDPDETTTGLGDPDYVRKVLANYQNIANGTPLPA